MTMLIAVLKILLLVLFGLLLVIFVLVSFVLMSLSSDWESEYGESARNYGAQNDRHLP